MSKTEEELKAASFQTTGTSAMRRGLSRRPLGTAQGRRVGAALSSNRDDRPHREASATRKQENAFLSSPGDDIEGCPSSPKLFLETEATLAGDVVKFIGLQRLVGMCEESNITSTKRLNRGEVVVGGLFEAVEDLQLNVSKVMSLKQNSTAFKLAFAPNFSGPLKPTSIVDGEVDASGPELGGTASCQWEGSDESPLDGAEAVAGHTENCKQVNAKGKADVSRLTWKFQFQQEQKTWRIVQLAVPEKIHRIQKEFEVRIRSITADENVTVTIGGQSSQNIENAHTCLSKIVEEIEPQITEECVSLGECSDVKWLQKMTWKGYKAFHSVAEGSSYCVITGLQPDVDKVKRKIKSLADSEARNSVTSTVKSVSFSLQTGQQIVIKQGDISSEEVDAIVTIAPSHLQTKDRSTEGDAVVVDNGELSTRVLVQVVMPSESSTGNSKSINEEQLIRKACFNILLRAEEKKCTTVAIPCIGAQLLHGRPKEVCARSLIYVTEKFLKDSSFTSITEVRFVDADTDTYDTFARIAREHFSVSADKAEKRCSPFHAEVDVTQSGPGPVQSTHDETTKEQCSICRYKGLCKSFQCRHSFCKSCLNGRVATDIRCPNCIHRNMRTQPKDGHMTRDASKSIKLPSYAQAGTIVITYEIPPGKQNCDSPNLIVSYNETKVTTYLPDNDEGRRMAELLKKAFEARLLFTIERCDSPGQSKYVMWKGISHKTNIDGGHENNGYPDAEYLQRLEAELKTIGIEQ